MKIAAAVAANVPRKATTCTFQLENKTKLLNAFLSEALFLQIATIVVDFPDQIVINQHLKHQVFLLLKSLQEQLRFDLSRTSPRHADSATNNRW